MAKKDKKSKEAKKARANEKATKAQSKAESKNKKKAKKIGEEDEDDVDIDQILEAFAKEQEQFEAIDISVCKRPSKRVNATMVSNPIQNKRELLLFGGESTIGPIATFYNDLFVYSTDSDIWRKVLSKNSPLPRSGHSMCVHPSGVILMFGGEFSSPKQSTFYHYGDTWILDAATKQWTKIESKKGPSARSGHRMAHWKNYIIMHGGFRDLGSSTTYLNDLWIFDITSYKWAQVEFPPNHPVPDARSGHSLIQCTDGAVLWGGFCKVKAGKGLQKGKILNDSWLLKMKSDPKAIRWERRRKQGFNPSARVGCSMTHHKGRGVLFGGVYDYEETEETLDSEFYNNLYSYHIETNRWHNLTVKPPRKSQKVFVKEKSRDADLEEILNSILAKANLNDEEEDNDDEKELIKEAEPMIDSDDEEISVKEYPILNQLPHARFNATTTVVDDTLYIFNGVYEKGDKEYILDSFYAIDLGKLEGVKVFWEDLTELDQDIPDSDEEEDDEEGDDDEDDEEDEDEEVGEKLVAEEEEEEEEEEEDEEDETPDPRPWLPHPKPFESLRAFYIRSGAQFLEWAISSNRDARGKHLKKASFDLCEDRWWERREKVSIAEESMDNLGGVVDIIEKDTTKTTKRR